MKELERREFMKLGLGAAITAVGAGIGSSAVAQR